MDIQQILEQTVTGMGYELVDFELQRNGLVRVFLDKPEGVAIEDCVAVSDQLSRVFFVEEIDYDRLEISSPGADRPLKKHADFVRFEGETIECKLRVAMGDARRKFRGVLTGVNETGFVLHWDDNGVEVQTPFLYAQLERVRLVPDFKIKSKVLSKADAKKAAKKATKFAKPN